MSYVIIPEVSGGLGSETEFKDSGHPRGVKKLDYVVAEWMGDAIITSHPVFLMSPHLVSTIFKRGLTGISDLGSGHVSLAGSFINGDSRELTVKSFRWVDLIGKAEVDDFWMNSEFDLEISQTAWEVVSKFPLSHALIREVGI